MKGAQGTRGERKLSYWGSPEHEKKTHLNAKGGEPEEGKNTNIGWVTQDPRGLKLENREEF